MKPPKFPKGVCSHSSCDGTDHPDWEHATSFEQIEDALKRYDHLCDEDGDRVVKVDVAESGKRATVTYVTRKASTEHDYAVSTEDGETDIGYVLVPVARVTDKEVEAAIKSILRKS